MGVKLRFLGCGDAFGTGGRHQTCFLVTHDSGRFLIDCGASALIAMRQQGVAPSEIDLVLLSHLHGDHFGGLPFLLLDAQYASRRTRRLAVAGPPGTEERLAQLMEASFPGSWQTRWSFDLELLELEVEERLEVQEVGVTGFEVRHPSGAPTLALRVEIDGRVVAYSGDTEWVPALTQLSRDADLLIAECYRFEPGVPYHLNHADLIEHVEELKTKRIVLTHLGQNALAHFGDLRFDVAEDGLELDL